jgi:hypothetical protein
MKIEAETSAADVDKTSDAKDTSITSEEEEAGTQGKTTVSGAKEPGMTTEGDGAGRVAQFGNLSELDKFPRSGTNMDDTNNGSSEERDENKNTGDTSNDAKDADVTNKPEDGRGSANDSTQDKKRVSKPGNSTKFEQFPRLTLTY